MSKSSSALLVKAIVLQGDIAVCDDHYQARRKAAAKRWGDGCALTVRIEPEEEAAKHGHFKALFGHYLKPVSDVTGDTVTELKDVMKARFLPDGLVSLTEMTAEQFDEFNWMVAQCIRDEYPEPCWDRCLDAIQKSERSHEARRHNEGRSRWQRGGPDERN